MPSTWKRSPFRRLSKLNILAGAHRTLFSTNKNGKRESGWTGELVKTLDGSSGYRQRSVWFIGDAEGGCGWQLGLNVSRQDEIKNKIFKVDNIDVTAGRCWTHPNARFVGEMRKFCLFYIFLYCRVM